MKKQMRFMSIFLHGAHFLLLICWKTINCSEFPTGSAALSDKEVHRVHGLDFG
jgi:hypothetical protein